MRRYNHAPSGGAVKAWQVLADKIYGENSQGFTSSMIEVDPCSAVEKYAQKMVTRGVNSRDLRIIWEV